VDTYVKTRWPAGYGEPLRTGQLQRVLEDYAGNIPGYVLYFPSRAQRSRPLRLFIEVVRSLAAQAT
jgi:hypothetical protein